MSGGLVYLAVMSVFFCGCLIAMWIFGTDSPSDVARQLSDAAERLAGTDRIIARQRYTESGAGEWDPDFDVLLIATERAVIRCTRRQSMFKSKAPVETQVTPWEDARMVASVDKGGNVSVGRWSPEDSPRVLDAARRRMRDPSGLLESALRVADGAELIAVVHGRHRHWPAILACTENGVVVGDVNWTQLVPWEKAPLVEAVAGVLPGAVLTYQLQNGPHRCRVDDAVLGDPCLLQRAVGLRGRT